MCSNKIDIKAIIFIVYFLVLQLIGMLFGYYNNYLVILGVIIYYINLYFFDKRFILRFSYIIFYITTNIFAVFIIETSEFYLNELGYYSHPNSSLLTIVIAHLLFIETIKYYSKKGNNFKIDSIDNATYILTDKTKIKVINVIKIILILAFILNIFLFLQVINKPFFYLKIDRFLYKELYLTPLSDVLTNMYLYIAPIISIYYFKTKDKKVIILILTILIYLFWIGHKFSYFIDLGYMFALPVIISISYKKLNKVISKMFLILFCLLMIVFFQSFIIWGRDIKESINYVNMRLAQQGQMWWAVYGNEKTKENNIDELGDEFRTYFNSNITEEEKLNSGIYKMMRMTTREDIFNQKVNVKKSRYAYSTQATVYYYFKGIGLMIFSVVSAIWYYFVNQQLLKSMMKIKLIQSVLWARLSIVSARMLLQSDFDKLFSIQTIIILSIILFIRFIEVNNKKVSIK